MLSTIPVVASLMTLAVAATPVERPNVVLVITDDQGYGDIGAHGNTMLRTPTLDRLHAIAVDRVPVAVWSGATRAEAESEGAN